MEHRRNPDPRSQDDVPSFLSGDVKWLLWKRFRSLELAAHALLNRAALLEHLSSYHTSLEFLKLYFGLVFVLI